MAWINEVWGSRAAITLIATTATSGDYDITIPPEWDEFWESIDASGNELRVTDANGTALDYGIDDGSGGAFSKTNRLGRIRINNYNPPIGSTGATLAWLYFRSSSTQGSGAGVAGTGGRSGYIDLASPSGVVIAPKSPIFGRLKPPQKIHKTAAERKALWIGLGYLLGHGFGKLRGGALNEELYYVTHDVLDTSGASASALVETTTIRFVFIPHGPFAGTWVRVIVVAGTTGNMYTSTTVAYIVAPSTGQIARSAIDIRVGIDVRDVRET